MPRHTTRDSKLSPALAYLKEKIEEEGLTDQQIADAVGVTSKTVSNWFNEPETHPIQHRHVETICTMAGISPQEIYGSGRTEFLSRSDSSEGVENRILDLERPLERACTPVQMVAALFPDVCELEPLQRLRAQYTGRYGSDFREMDNNNVVRRRFDEFAAVRAQRREHFEKDGYHIECLMDRETLEQWINGKGIYSHVSLAENHPDYVAGDESGNRIRAVLEQSRHLLELMKEGAGAGFQRQHLSLRLAEPHTVQNHYALLKSHREKPVYIMEGNTGVLISNERDVTNKVQRDFYSVWEKGRVANYGLVNNNDWIGFFTVLNRHLEQCLEQGAFNEFSIADHIEEISELSSGLSSGRLSFAEKAVERRRTKTSRNNSL